MEALLQNVLSDFARRLVAGPSDLVQTPDNSTAIGPVAKAAGIKKAATYKAGIAGASVRAALVVDVVAREVPAPDPVAAALREQASMQEDSGVTVKDISMGDLPGANEEQAVDTAAAHRAMVVSNTNILEMTIKLLVSSSTIDQFLGIGDQVSVGQTTLTLGHLIFQRLGVAGKGYTLCGPLESTQGIGDPYNYIQQHTNDLRASVQGVRDTGVEAGAMLTHAHVVFYDLDAIGNNATAAQLALSNEMLWRGVASSAATLRQLFVTTYVPMCPKLKASVLPNLQTLSLTVKSINRNYEAEWNALPTGLNDIEAPRLAHVHVSGNDDTVQAFWGDLPQNFKQWVRSLKGVKPENLELTIANMSRRDIFFNQLTDDLRVHRVNVKSRGEVYVYGQFPAKLFQVTNTNRRSDNTRLLLLSSPDSAQDAEPVTVLSCHGLYSARVPVQVVTKNTLLDVRHAIINFKYNNAPEGTVENLCVVMKNEDDMFSPYPVQKIRNSPLYVQAVQKELVFASNIPLDPMGYGKWLVAVNSA